MGQARNLEIESDVGGGGKIGGDVSYVRGRRRKVIYCRNPQKCKGTDRSS
jgi:hypothetical protein